MASRYPIRLEQSSYASKGRRNTEPFPGEGGGQPSPLVNSGCQDREAIEGHDWYRHCSQHMPKALGERANDPVRATKRTDLHCACYEALELGSFLPVAAAVTGAFASRTAVMLLQTLGVGRI